MVEKGEAIYRYFFCDVIVINGTSTVEIEASCVHKPIVIVRTTDTEYDPMETIRYGAAKLVNTDDIDSLESAIISPFTEDIFRGQQSLINYHNIGFDGKMGDRVNMAIFDILKMDIANE